MSARVQFEELDAIDGEVIPQRILLSTLADLLGELSRLVSGDAPVPEGRAVEAPPPFPVDTVDDGSTVYYACTTTYTPGTPGLLGTVGLGSANPGYSQVCTPAAVVTNP